MEQLIKSNGHTNIWSAPQTTLRSPSETIMRNAICQVAKEARFNFKRALGTGSQVAILHAKSKMDVATFMIRNYRQAFVKRPL